MNEYILEKHLEMHQLIMTEVKKVVPTKKTIHGREFSLDEVIINEDGNLVAHYTRYVGCGDYDRATEYLQPYDLYKEQT